MSFWQSNLSLYLLPVPSVLCAAIVACLDYWRTKELDIPKAIALGIPIPLALSYFLWLGQLPNWFSYAKFLAPQAFVLFPTGVWLLLAAIRQREFSILSTLPILLLGAIGHWWTVAALVVGTRG